MPTGQLQGHLDLLRRRYEQLLDDGAGPDAFLSETLPLIGSSDGVKAAALWLVDAQGRTRLALDHKLSDLLGGERFSLDEEHQGLLQQTLADGRSRVITGRDPGQTGMEAHSLVLAGIRREHQGAGVVELYVDEAPAADDLVHLRNVAELAAAYTSQFLTQGPTGRKAGSQDLQFWERFDRFTLQLQRSLDLSEVVMIAVNDGRHLLGCDRLSLALQHGPKTRISGISGQDEVQKRANQIKAMARLAERVMHGGVPITYRGAIEDLPPPLEQPFADYLVESRSRMVRLVPLLDNEHVSRTDEERLDAGAKKPRKVIGCLIAEQTTESRPRPNLIERTDLIADHIAAAVGNARRHESIFLLPVWRLLGRGLAWFRGRNLWITAAVLAGIALVGLGLAVIPWEYRVDAVGQAMPSVKHGVFAPRDAQVERVLVESNERVAKGTRLLLLTSAELEERATQLAGEISRLKEETYKLLREREESRRAGDREREQQAYTQYRQARTDLAAREEELAIIDSERAKLIVTSPADGVVATFQIEQLLRNRPVQRGELLLEVMDDTGDWQLELEVPEYRMGHLLHALDDSPDGRLTVDYTPATDARLTLRAEMTEVATRSNQSEDEGTIVQVYAAIDPDDLPGRRIGAEVDAHIRCGDKSLFYCLFGDVVEFVQRHVWW